TLRERGSMENDYVLRIEKDIEALREKERKTKEAWQSLRRRRVRKERALRALREAESDEPTATRAEIRERAIAILKERGPMDREALRAALANELSSESRSTSALALNLSHLASELEEHGLTAGARD